MTGSGSGSGDTGSGSQAKRSAATGAARKLGPATAPPHCAQEWWDELHESWSGLPPVLDLGAAGGPPMGYIESLGGLDPA